MPRAGYGIDGLGGRDRLFQRDDVDSRRHHLPYRTIGEIEQSVDDLPLDRLDLALLHAELHQRSDVLLSDGRHVTAGGQPEQPEQAPSDCGEHAGNRTKDAAQLPDRRCHGE